MKVLAADDHAANLLLVKASLKNAGHEVVTVVDGREAIRELMRTKFDAVVTDWMMPAVDGMDLVRYIRRSVRPQPVVIMITASTDPEGRDSAMSAGADDFMLKPIEPRDLVERLANCLARQSQPMPAVPASRAAAPAAPRRRAEAPDGAAGTFMGIGIGASTGGPPAVEELFKAITPTTHAAFYVVIHGPAWMLSSYVRTLQRNTSMPVSLARNGVRSEAGHVYVCPGDIHMGVGKVSLGLEMLDTPPENYVKPAVDPLFRSLASAFGTRGVGVILTGMGKDGCLGCAAIAQAGGQVFVQDPATAVIGAMPSAVIQAGIAHTALPIPEIGAALNRVIARHVGRAKG